MSRNRLRVASVLVTIMKGDRASYPALAVKTCRFLE